MILFLFFILKFVLFARITFLNMKNVSVLLAYIKHQKQTALNKKKMT